MRRVHVPAEEPGPITAACEERGAAAPEPRSIALAFMGPGSPLRSGRDIGPAVPSLSLRAPLASLLRLPVLAYRYSLSMLIGRRCRYLPTCSEFADEALARHGAWAGGWMAAGRVCRCHPWGADGYDPVPGELPSDATWSRPWRYGRRAASPACEAVAEP